MTGRKNRTSRRIGFGLLVLTMIPIGPWPCSGQARSQIEAAVRDIGREFVPDRRLELFEVEVGEDLQLTGLTTLPRAKDALFRKLEGLGLAGRVSDRIMILPDPALGSESWALVSVSVANLRTRPGHSQELTSQVLMGTPVRILMKDGGWSRVRTPEGYIAWVDGGAIQPMAREDLDRWNSGNRVMFSDDFGLVRREISSEEVAGDVSLGGIMQAGDASAGWTRVTLPDGRTGFLPSADLVSLEQVEAAGAAGDLPSAASLIALARRFMGRPYLWGGTSAHGVDCSGFMKTVFYRHGIILSRDANQQVLHGREIPFQGEVQLLEPGDLLFFGRAATADRGERVSHVGMYIGDGRFIHSAGSPARVGVNSLVEADPDFSRSLRDILLHVRRIEIPDTEEGPWSIAKHEWYHRQGSPR